MVNRYVGRKVRKPARSGASPIVFGGSCTAFGRPVVPEVNSRLGITRWSPRSSIGARPSTNASSPAPVMPVSGRRTTVTPNGPTAWRVAASVVESTRASRAPDSSAM